MHYELENFFFAINRSSMFKLYERIISSHGLNLLIEWLYFSLEDSIDFFEIFALVRFFKKQTSIIFFMK